MVHIHPRAMSVQVERMISVVQVVLLGTGQRTGHVDTDKHTYHTQVKYLYRVLRHK
jgi:hypothetical protein